MKRKGCGCQDAGFFDSGPYTPIANARWDRLGPGVYEAGAIAANEARGQIGVVRLTGYDDGKPKYNWPDGIFLVPLLGGSGRGARIRAEFRGKVLEIPAPLETAFPERGTGYKVGDRLRIATWFGPEVVVTKVYDGTNQPKDWLARDDQPRTPPRVSATAEAEQSGGALVLVALAGLAWMLTAKP